MLLLEIEAHNWYVTKVLLPEKKKSPAARREKLINFSLAMRDRQCGSRSRWSLLCPRTSRTGLEPALSRNMVWMSTFLIVTLVTRFLPLERSRGVGLEPSMVGPTAKEPGHSL